MKKFGGTHWYRYDLELDNSGQPVFDPDLLRQNENYTLSGTYNGCDLNVVAGSDCALYGTADPQGCSPMIVVYQGFWHAYAYERPGRFRFDIDVGARSQLLMWSGEAAYGGPDHRWTPETAEFNVHGDSYGTTWDTPVVVHGDLLPMTFVYASWGAPGTSVWFNPRVTDTFGYRYGLQSWFIEECQPGSPFRP